ncbi:unnamed protein product [Pieris macdunnoughi]|uniref:Uncharacterized protein n=1 Tax=Pieris macdunnoughi TaxID=345717 RepID=A0A821XBQ3_9NEOP|nr:unnamed protein product [Pieris macdunnoughi]
MLKVKDDVIKFLEKDENSRMCPGKRDYLKSKDGICRFQTLPAKTWAIENDKQEVVTEFEQISETWRCYCQLLFLDPQSRLSISTEPEPENLETDILLSEVRTAIKNLKSKIATGRDAIPIKTIKALGERGDQMFHLICNKVWQTGVWPSEWTHTIFTPLHKKGSTKKCNNYRLIALIPHASKIVVTYS